MKPVLTLLAGPNGGGKSYYSHFFVENGLINSLPINIDALEESVDKNRIPDDPMRYERKLKAEIDKVFNELCSEAIANNSDFAFECNLRLDQLFCVNRFAEAGYKINIIYIWLDSIEKSQQRVQVRINEGGHFVGFESIKVNFYEGLKNFDQSVFEHNWDHVYLIDNSKDAKSKGETLSLLFEMNNNQIIQIADNFFSVERKMLLPKVCNLLEKK